MSCNRCNCACEVQDEKPELDINCLYKKLIHHENKLSSYVPLGLNSTGWSCLGKHISFTPTMAGLSYLEYKNIIPQSDFILEGEIKINSLFSTTGSVGFLYAWDGVTSNTEPYGPTWAYLNLAGSAANITSAALVVHNYLNPSTAISHTLSGIHSNKWYGIRLVVAGNKTSVYFKYGKRYIFLLQVNSLGIDPFSPLPHAFSGGYVALFSNSVAFEFRNFQALSLKLPWDEI